jgi:hypothetical protein
VSQDHGDAAQDHTAAEGQTAHPSPPFQVWDESLVDMVMMFSSLDLEIQLNIALLLRARQLNADPIPLIIKDGYLLFMFRVRNFRIHVIRIYFISGSESFSII